MIVTSALDSARDATARRDWVAAAEAFSRAAEIDPTAEAFEGLAEASWWNHLEGPTFQARERAYHLYRHRGDRASAARMALWLAEDSLEFRGEPAVCNGWMRRARRLLRGLEGSGAHAWLLFQEGHLALMLRNDTAAGASAGAETAERGRALDDPDLEMLGLALEGLSRVSAGEIEDGMTRIDEAGALSVSDETRDIIAKGTALCYVMDACDRVRDYDRASQWCERADALAARSDVSFLPAICRPHLAVVLIWRGRWAEAEGLLVESAAQMRLLRPPMTAEAVIRLAELRVRQGRLDEASVLFAQAEGDGLAHVGMGEFALARGDSLGAQELAERRLRHLPRENRIERAPALELLARACLSRGHLDGAARALIELEAGAAVVGTAPVVGSARYISGLVALARGEASSARDQFEEAFDCFRRDAAPFEAARTRVDLANALRMLGQGAAAERELRAAEQSLRDLGAAAEADRAGRLLTLPPDDPQRRRARQAGLTERELEVLGWLASGASNQELADRLYLSTRTVERHISGIYAKLGLTGRHARAAATAWAHEAGLARLEPH